MAAKKKKKSTRRTNRKSPATARELKVWLGALFLLVFLVASLALLQQIKHVFAPPAPVVQSEFPEQVLSREQARARFEQSLPVLVAKGRVDRSVETDRMRYQIGDSVPEAARFDAFVRRLQASGGNWQVGLPRDGRVQVEAEGRWHFELLFVPPPTPAPLPPAISLPETTRARVAIIMDDLGQDLHSARQLAALDLAVTFAVLPELPHSAEVAELGHRQGREIIVHIPMEPIGYPVTNPGSNALLTELSDEEIRQRLQGFWPQVPHAVGGNNHMGSRFTQEPHGMRIVLEEMARRGLFFIDSLTTGSSVGLATAREFGVPAAGRDVFLDNDQDVAKIRHELRRLIRVAQKQGQAIGICHPYRETLEALRLEQDSFARAGVEVVPVSRLFPQSAEGR